MNRRRRYFRAFFPTLVPALILACRFITPGTELLVRLPPLPEGTAGLVSSRVLLHVEDGAENSLVRSCEAGDELTVRIRKSAAVSLSAHYDGGVPPAGGVLPWDGKDGGIIELGFSGGFTAEIMRQLAGDGIPLECINYPRLCCEIQERSQGNPWRLDAGRIRTALRAGSFTVRDLRLLDEYLLPPGALPGGLWLPANPLAPPLAADRENRASEGRGVYYSGTAAGVLWCDGLGWRFYTVDGVIDSSGDWIP
jgi:hypothetical protein